MAILNGVRKVAVFVDSNQSDKTEVSDMGGMGVELIAGGVVILAAILIPIAAIIVAQKSST